MASIALMAITSPLGRAQPIKFQRRLRDDVPLYAGVRRAGRSRVARVRFVRTIEYEESKTETNPAQTVILCLSHKTIFPNS